MRITTGLHSACVIAALIVSLGGCAISHVTSQTTDPLYDSKTDPKFDSCLLGTWLPSLFCIELRKGEGNAYLASAGFLGEVPADPGVHNEASPMHLVAIGRYNYFFAAPKPDESGTTLTSCCRVEIVGEKIALRQLDLQAVAADLEKHPGTLKHQWQPTTQPDCTQPSATTPASIPTTEPTTQDFRNGNLKITDDSKAIRDYLIKHQDDPDFWKDALYFIRVGK